MNSSANVFVTKDQYETLVRDISVLFLYQPTIALIAKDETINKIITDDLDIIYTYEAINLPSETKTDDYLIAYRTLSGVNYKPHKLTPAQIDDVEDKINVLQIFIKNSLNSDWTSILDSFKTKANPDETVVVAPSTTTQLNNPETIEPVSVNEVPKQDFSGQKNYNSEEFMRRNNVNMDQIADSMIYASATKLYYADVMSNKVYRYDSKPAIFVWIKWIYIIFGMLFALMYLASQIIAVTTNGYFLFKDIASGDSMTYNDFVRSSSYFYRSDYLSMVLSILIVSMLFFSLYGQVKNSKNENVKYSCKVGTSALMLIFFMLSILLPVFQNSISPFNWINDLDRFRHVTGLISVTGTSQNPESVTINNPALYDSMYALSIFYILCTISLGINIVMAVAIKVIRPKDDLERMKACIQKYVDDIKAGRISMDSSGTSTGGNGFFSGRNPFSPF